MKRTALDTPENASQAGTMHQLGGAKARASPPANRLLLVCSRQHDGASLPDACRRTTEFCAVIRTASRGRCTHCGSNNVQVATLINGEIIGRCQHCWKTFSLGVAMLVGYVVDDDVEDDGCAACERYVLQPRNPERPR